MIYIKATRDTGLSRRADNKSIASRYFKCRKDAKHNREINAAQYNGI
jgi:hypothetical protein